MGAVMFACSKAGHDKGRIYAVAGSSGDKVLLCDGDKRPLERPKAKNAKHIQIIRNLPEEIVSMCEQNGKLYNEGIKRALKQYTLKRLEESDVKG